MKLNQLRIQKLFGYYNFDINLKKGVTILHGPNGSGKTIILDILHCILGGEIRGLFQYDFQAIVLTSAKGRKKVNLTIIQKSGKDRCLAVRFEGASFIISRDSSFMSMKDHASLRDFQEKMHNEYVVTYLPLSRLSRDSSTTEDRYEKKEDRIRRVIRGFPPREVVRSLRDSDSFNRSLRDAQTLIREKHQKILSQIDENNHIVKREILKKLLNPSEFKPQKFPTGVGQKEVEAAGMGMKTILDKISTFKKDYAKVSREFEETGLMGESEFKKILDKSFSDFEKCIIELNQLLQGMFTAMGKNGAKTTQNPQREHKKFELFVNSVTRLAIKGEEITRLIDVMGILLKTNQKNKLVRKPLTQYLDIVNRFFKEGSKEVIIDSDGEIRIKLLDVNSEIDVVNLSSGEKQLFILFAHLLFELSGVENGILLVDEPELSLHLSWQRKFLSSVQEASKDTEIIVATHSPELVGGYEKNEVLVKGTI